MGRGVDDDENLLCSAPMWGPLSVHQPPHKPPFLELQSNCMVPTLIPIGRILIGD